MLVTAMEKTVRDILLDNHMRRSGKIDRLRELRSEARAIQRAGSESAMSADDGLQDDLRVIEKALHDLDADVLHKGAATL
ncbi:MULTISPECIES: hypothetical protein [unclassified Rhizobium]|uniref:hypothetical protein n=1 Tax=unclassified Rhizobium TaxID=2613769 RepID=UPI00064850BC|nr:MULTISPECIES: hypothetical protein [unclassified Rhizobium]MBN8953097.1 hypothetical protein [Rhizobium tropici]OJY75778.1 MAG: hypothetical protein BGP09_07015 [Rhizobium sp. 60-20]RKD75001.1 hypothetical protein BJ928_1011360 [Rhizobium sp. WW_1]